MIIRHWLQRGRFGIIMVSLSATLMVAIPASSAMDALNRSGADGQRAAAAWLGQTDGLPLDQGHQGATVLGLQWSLDALGYRPGPLDSIYGPQTRQALRIFQDQAGLTVDGITGPETRRALAADLAAHLGAHHTVVRGETLSGIAARYSISLSLLQEINQIDQPDLIRIADRMIVPPSEPRLRSIFLAAVTTAPAESSLMKPPVQTQLPELPELPILRHTSLTPTFDPGLVSFNDPVILAAGSLSALSPNGPAGTRSPGTGQSPEASEARPSGGSNSDAAGGTTRETAFIPVALTFNDGPETKITPALLDLLKSAQIPASFFVIGAEAAANPNIIRRMSDEGHQIENHTWSHVNLTDLTQRQIRREIDRTAELLETFTGRRSTLLRPPGGAFDDRLIGTALTAGHQMLFWTNIGSEDLPGVNQNTLTRWLERAAFPGAIIMLHADNAVSLAALRAVIPQWQERGVQFFTVNDLLAMIDNGPPAASLP